MTYEETLSALQGMLGSQVLVTVSPVDQAEAVTVMIVGELAVGLPEDGGYLDRGQPSSETVTFRVGDQEQVGCRGGFVLWKDQFDGAVMTEDSDGLTTVIVFDRGVGVGVRVLDR